ncbi:MAG: hypothetical protein R3Y63_03550 [Eubacteriales bacterium]
MTCRHRFCIYQEDNQCTAGEVSLDEVGMVRIVLYFFVRRSTGEGKRKTQKEIRL